MSVKIEQLHNVRSQYSLCEISLTPSEYRAMGAMGDVTDTIVDVLSTNSRVREQTEQWLPADVRTELEFYRMWDHAQLRDDYKNRVRLLWLLACALCDAERKRKANG